MRRHKQGLFRFIKSYIGDADEALDLTQDSFVSAWTALGRYDAARPFDVWLRRIALNKCRDWARRRAVRSFFFGAVSLEDAGPHLASPAPGASQEPRLAALEAAIAALPRSLKEPLLLAAIEQRSHKETALLLGCSAKAVEMRLYRARALLAQALGAPLDDDEG